MITDEMIASAAEELANAMNESLPDPDSCDHQFSDRFEKRMEKVIRKANHPVFYRTLKQAACFVLIVSVGFASVMIFSQDIRAAVWGWIKQQHDELLYQFSFEGNSGESNTYTYYPGWIPDNCEFFASQQTPGDRDYIYTNQKGRFISFTYINDGTKEDVYLGIADSVEEAVVINGRPGTMYISESQENQETYNNNALIWFDESKTVLFCVEGDLEKKELIKIAENIQKKQDSK